MAVAAASLALAGCATGSGPGGSGGPGGSSGATALTVRVDSGASTPSHSYTLTCDPAGGDHPAAVAACSALAAVGDPFRPTPSGMACDLIYGGPQRATVTGTYRGRAVSASFSRVNGCEVARWNALVALLVERGGA